MAMVRESAEVRSHEDDSSPSSPETAPANLLSVAMPSVRRSMDSFYHQPTSPIERPASPPSYDEFPFMSSPSLRRRFNIQPREDEGREILPPYSSAISLENVFMKKMELEGAVHKASDRNWYRVMVTLQGTALTFHKCKSPGIFGGAMSGSKSTPDFPAGTTRGQFLRSYNLQHADVGIAADYLKRRYVIRVRAETEQFLLSCHKIETFVLWLQSLFAAIDLAPPLDDREIPQDLSIPRRPRRRRDRATVAGFSNIERNEQLIREQEEIMRTHFPNLATTPIVEEEIDEGEEEDDEEEEEGQDADEISPDPSPPETPRTRTPTPFSSPSQASILGSATFGHAPHQTSTPHTTSLLLRTRNALTNNHSSTSHPANPPNPSISPDGKWAPQHQWTHFYDMLYAKRCMAILTHRSPRKSNLVIMKGKQWIIDWATGKLTRCEPPEYGEVVMGFGGKVGMDVRVAEIERV